MPLRDVVARTVGIPAAEARRRNSIKDKGMRLSEFQESIERTYFERDAARGLDGTFMWFIEEVGELSTALREKDVAAQKEEFADVLAWLCTLASLVGIRMEDAAEKYKAGCPRCSRLPCECPTKGNG